MKVKKNRNQQNARKYFMCTWRKKYCKALKKRNIKKTIKNDFKKHVFRESVANL